MSVNTHRPSSGAAGGWKPSTDLEIGDNAKPEAAHPAERKASLIQPDDLGFFRVQSVDLFVADVHGRHPCQGEARGAEI